MSVLEVTQRAGAGPGALPDAEIGAGEEPSEQWPEPETSTASAVHWSPPSTRRRLAAWLVDLVIVVAASLGVALTQARTFRPAGSLTPDHRALLEHLEQGRAIVVTTGDTVRAWSGVGLWITVISFALLALIVLALLPANLGGRTPGMAVTGLRVISASGQAARLEQHLLRTAFGFVDLLPVVVPGLVGFAIIARSNDGRRLGDRWTGTRVVDLRPPERPVDPSASPVGHRTRRPASQMATEAGANDRQPTVTVLPSSPVDDRQPTESLRSSSVVAQVGSGERPIGSVPPPVGRSQRGSTGDPSTVADSGPGSPPGGDGPVAGASVAATADEGAPSSGEGASGSGQAVDVEWSDEHQAWTICDPGSGRRLRHDPTTDQWVLIDDEGRSTTA